MDENWDHLIDREGMRSDEWYLTGNIHASRSEYGQALFAYDRAVPKSNFPERLSYRIGITMSKMGKIMEAKKAFRSTIELEQYILDAGCIRNVMTFSPEENAAAIDRFDEAFRRSPGSVEFLHLRGLAHAKECHYEIAVECSRNAISLEPKLLKAWRLNGCCLYLLGQFKEADKSFDRYIALEDLNSAKGMAMTFFSTGNYHKAIEFFDRVIAVEPDNITALEYKAKSLEKLGRLQDAKIFYDKAQKAESLNVDQQHD